VNHAGRQRAHKAEGIADGDDEFAWAQPIRIAQRCGGQIGRSDMQYREIAARITRGNLGWE
jgi:hypothetical protein